jgi:hypothetical protein
MFIWLPGWTLDIIVPAIEGRLWLLYCGAAIEEWCDVETGEIRFEGWKSCWDIAV